MPSWVAFIQSLGRVWVFVKWPHLDQKWVMGFFSKAPESALWGLSFTLRHSAKWYKGWRTSDVKTTQDAGRDPWDLLIKPHIPVLC